MKLTLKCISPPKKRMGSVMFRDVVKSKYSKMLIIDPREYARLP